ncbi:hypothetical protein MASR2M78_13830 [Treponema sp.]
MNKYIFVTGGVCSSLGKGIAASSLGALLEGRGLNVRMVKCDPYLNVDAGTMSPYQHGEVYVTDDGAETDLDLGNYARFTSSPYQKLTPLQPARSMILLFAKNVKAAIWGVPFKSSPTLPMK